MGRMTGLKGGQEQMGFSKAKEVFQSKALSISLLRLSRRQLRSGGAPDEQPERLPLWLPLLIPALATDEIKGVAMHGIVPSATHQEIVPSPQLKGESLAVRVSAADRFLLGWWWPGGGVVEFESGAIPVRSGRTTTEVRLSVETPVTTHSGNHHQIRIVPQTIQKSWGGIATIDR